MITATVGTALLIVVVVTSLVIVRRRLPYEWWYAVHLTAYAAIALSWFHEIPTGNELDDPSGRRRLLALALRRRRSRCSSLFRVVQPLVRTLALGLRVERGRASRAPASSRCASAAAASSGCDAQRGPVLPLAVPLDARPLVGGAPVLALGGARDGGSFRITVKGVGGYTRRLARARVRERACSPRARSASSPTRCAVATRRC